MAKGAKGASAVRFGLFEADLAARELRKKGRRVRLQQQPFQALALLVQRPGEIVTRKELEKALWPDGTFIEFDQGLNAAIKKARHALRDSPRNPRFIETVPRRGYRFIGDVHVNGETARRRIAAWAMMLFGLVRSTAVLLMPTR